MNESTIKEDERKKITEVYYPETHNRYIQRRMHDDKREIYQTLKNIKHPNIPKIYNIEFDSDTVVTEEYVDGTKLSTLIENGTKFTKSEIKSITKQLVSAMAELHKFNIIHRDIKPDNIIIDKSNHLWLIDYDIARMWREEIRRDTEAMGTFGYAPIEQYGMMPTDFKTDIYAFGVTLMQVLECSEKRGRLYKIAEKCKRLDPAQRYQSAQKIISALNLSGILKVLITLASVLGIIALCFILNNAVFKENPITKEDIKNPESGVIGFTDEIVEVDEEINSLLNFYDFGFSEYEKQFRSSQYYATADIFAVDDVWAHLSFIEDIEKSGTIYMGKGKDTKIEAKIKLEEGVVYLDLKDPYGHSFKGDFSYDSDIPFTLTYTEDRRQNAEFICRDLDGDFVEELLIGVNDCSFKIADGKVFCYFNYSQAWCLKYDESRGFTLCNGEMFSDNGKFAFVTDDLRVHLPAYSFSDDGICGYVLKGTNIIPFY